MSTAHYRSRYGGDHRIARCCPKQGNAIMSFFGWRGWLYVVGLRRSVGGSQFCSMLPAFVFEARPVFPVMDAVRVELEAMAFRDVLKRQ
jgi:hypothetical protein